MKKSNLFGILLIIFTFLLLVLGLQENPKITLIKYLGDTVKIFFGIFIGSLLVEDDSK